jgi:hypothetical protein
MRVVLPAAFAFMLASCGTYGPKGNDTGGIIPWSIENEQAGLVIAQQNCGRYGKYAVITSVHRVYGDYIAYICQFDPPVARRYFRRRAISVRG